jgi:hypothetical protein
MLPARVQSRPDHSLAPAHSACGGHFRSLTLPRYGRDTLGAVRPRGSSLEWVSSERSQIPSADLPVLASLVCLVPRVALAGMPAGAFAFRAPLFVAVSVSNSYREVHRRHGEH